MAAARTRARSSLGLALLAAVALGLVLLRAAPPAAGPEAASAFVAGAPPALRGPVARRWSPVALFAASDSTMDKVADVIADQLGVDKDKVIRTATLTELGADSLDIVESVMALEEAFDVELPDDETTSLKNCGDVADLIQGKL
uniref:Acyl carrier protein n=2 Tax=Alexandrium catenella TaxID=2925 RepID=A0A6T9SE60_ALECA